MVFNRKVLETDLAFDSLRKYSDFMEAQMEEVHRCERVVLEGKRPSGDDEESLHLFWDDQQFLKEEFDKELIPLMRYAFVILLHSVFERRLVRFCTDIEHAKKLPISLKEIAGQGSLEKARTYLTKLACMPVTKINDWNELKKYQLVRNCIAHANGFVDEVKRPEDKVLLSNLENQNIGISVDKGRLKLEKSYCDKNLDVLHNFMKNLLLAAGWNHEN